MEVSSLVEVSSFGWWLFEAWMYSGGCAELVEEVVLVAVWRFAVWRFACLGLCVGGVVDTRFFLLGLLGFGVTIWDEEFGVAVVVGVPGCEVMGGRFDVEVPDGGVTGSLVVVFGMVVFSGVMVVVKVSRSLAVGLVLLRGMVRWLMML